MRDRLDNLLIATSCGVVKLARWKPSGDSNQNKTGSFEVRDSCSAFSSEDSCRMDAAPKSNPRGILMSVSRDIQVQTRTSTVIAISKHVDELLLVTVAWTLEPRLVLQNLSAPVASQLKV